MKKIIFITNGHLYDEGRKKTEEWIGSVLKDIFSDVIVFDDTAFRAILTIDENGDVETIFNKK